RSGGPGRHVQPGRRGQDALAAATGGGEGECGRRRGDAADVGDPGPAAGRRCGAYAAAERAAAAVGDRAAVLPLGRTGRWYTGSGAAADVRHARTAADLGSDADPAVERAAAAVGNGAAVLALRGAGGGDTRRRGNIGERAAPAGLVGATGDPKVDRAARRSRPVRDEVDGGRADEGGATLGPGPGRRRPAADARPRGGPPPAPRPGAGPAPCD